MKPTDSHPRVCVIIPAYNESMVIKKVLEEVIPFADITVVVDDGSSDLTANLALEYPVILLQHPLNLGQGAALQTGLDYAVSQQVDFIVTFDADGQHSPEQIPKLVDICKRGSFDVVLGSRFLKGGKAENIPSSRRFALKLATIFSKWITGLKITYIHNGFRVITKSAAAQIRITHIGMAHASEILSQISKLNLKYCEAPVTIRYSEYSKKKGQSLSDFNHFSWDIWTERIQ